MRLRSVVRHVARPRSRPSRRSRPIRRRHRRRVQIAACASSSSRTTCGSPSVSDHREARLLVVGVAPRRDAARKARRAANRLSTPALPPRLDPRARSERGGRGRVGELKNTTRFIELSTTATELARPTVPPFWKRESQAFGGDLPQPASKSPRAPNHRYDQSLVVILPLSLKARSR